MSVPTILRLLLMENEKLRNKIDFQNFSYRCYNLVTARQNIYPES